MVERERFIITSGKEKGAGWKTNIKRLKKQNSQPAIETNGTIKKWRARSKKTGSGRAYPGKEGTFLSRERG